jgi:hypothetical protein
MDLIQTVHIGCRWEPTLNSGYDDGETGVARSGGAACTGHARPALTTSQAKLGFGHSNTNFAKTVPIYSSYYGTSSKRATAFTCDLGQLAFIQLPSRLT